jgi:photosystem II stability/assembly factor-like uncharacterized protein
MRGDFSRVTFRPENHYSGVRLQQGRVQLDSEFNEHVDIEWYRDRQTTKDVVGRHGVPFEAGGFEIRATVLLRGVGASGAEAWAVGADGALLHAQNVAASNAGWTLVPPPTGAGSFNAVHVAATRPWWAVGDGAKIHRQVDGGWSAPEAVPGGVTADLFGVTGDATNAWAVGAGGTILFWDGNAWTRQTAPPDVTHTLRSAHLVGNDVVIVGDDGAILRTTNRGAAWSIQAAPPGTGNLRAVHVVGASDMWAVGEQGTVLRWNGTNWSTQSLAGATSTFRDVAFDGAVGVIVGDGGTIFRTTNGGASWAREVVAGVREDLHAVSFAGANAVAVGDAVTLLRGSSGWTRTPALPSSATGPLGRSLTISPGAAYVDGVRCENDTTVSYTAQPDPLFEEDPFPPADGTYGVYLRVQQQHLTAVDRDELREVALGGPDSATRTRTAWQADLFPIAAANPTCAGLEAVLPTEPSRGRLRARTEPSELPTSDCMVPANGGYRRLENQLYRVEIHLGSDDTGGPTFKWSRDNGSLVARMLTVTKQASQTTGSVRVSAVGRDDLLSFGSEQVVELTDDERALRGLPGILADVDRVEGDELKLSNFRPAGAVTMADFGTRPIVRRWDGYDDVAAGWTPLEDGVEVDFAQGPQAAGSFRAGDYWTIPARTLTGSVQWPERGGVPVFEERHGPTLRYAPLALVTVANGTWSVRSDCRNLFPPLTGLVQLYYVGGDGQEAMPDIPQSAANTTRLERELEVGVANGKFPLVGRRVRFRVTGGQGRVQLGSGQQQQSVDAVTDANGIAKCWWWVDGQTFSQQVEASLIDDPDQAAPAVIHFDAQLSVASKVAFDGAGCTTLQPEENVQAAITKLARLTRLYALSGSGEDYQRADPPLVLRALVANECGPVANAIVQFARVANRGNGALSTPTASTDANGIATCTWTPDTSTPTQEVSATLTQVPGPLVIHDPRQASFVANLAHALAIDYTPPEDCAEFKGAKTVQAAIDRLLAQLPRLYHVSGDGLEGDVDEGVPLRVGVANACGVSSNPFVVFERDEGTNEWEEIFRTQPEDGIATFAYTLTDAPRQFLRAFLADEDGNRLGDPVYFTLSLRAVGPGAAPAAMLRSRATQSMPSAQLAYVSFGGETEDFDPFKMHDPEFANGTALRAVRAGTYVAVGEVQWVANELGYRTAEIRRNGELIAKVGGPPLKPPALTTQQVSAILRMNEGQFVQLAAFQGSGGPLDIQGGSFSIAWTGP